MLTKPTIISVESTEDNTDKTDKTDKKLYFVQRHIPRHIHRARTGRVPPSTHYFVSYRMTRTPSFCSIYGDYFVTQVRHSPFNIPLAALREIKQPIRVKIAEFKTSSPEQLTETLEKFSLIHSQMIKRNPKVFKHQCLVRGLTTASDQTAEACSGVFACIDDDPLNKLANSITQALNNSAMLESSNRYLGQALKIVFISNKDSLGDRNNSPMNATKILSAFKDSYFGYLNCSGMEITTFNHTNKSTDVVDFIDFHP